MKPQRYGVLFVFLGAVFWSLNAPLVKFIQMDAMLVCGLRSLIAGVALLPFLRIRKLRWNRWMALYILSYTCLGITLIYALSTTSATIAVGMQYTGMIWIFLGNILFKKVRPSWRQLVPVVFIIVGVVFFMVSGMSGQSHMTGNLVAVLEGFCFAGITISAKKAAGDNPLGLTAVANISSALFVFGFLSPSFGDLVGLSSTSWTVMLLLGIVQVGMGFSCYSIGVKYISAQKASVLALWEMILGPVWVALFLQDYPTPPVLVGFFIVLIGMVLDAVLSSPKAFTKKELV